MLKVTGIDIYLAVLLSNTFTVLAVMSAAYLWRNRFAKGITEQKILAISAISLFLTNGYIYISEWRVGNTVGGGIFAASFSTIVIFYIYNRCLRKP